MATKTEEASAETADIPSIVAEQLLSLQERRRDDEREDAFDDPENEVEAILSKKETHKGVFFLVKWKNTPGTSWERRDTLEGNELLEEFEKKQASVQDPPDVPVMTSNGPMITFVQMIDKALKHHGGKATMHQIYFFLEKNYEAEIKKHKVKDWRRSVAGTLSVRYPKLEMGAEQKGHLWGVRDPNYKRKNKPKANKKKRKHYDSEESPDVDEESPKPKRHQPRSSSMKQSLNDSIEDSGATLLMDIKTDNEPDDFSASGGSQMPFSKMVDNALSSLNGRGTFSQICQHIESTFPNALKNRKSWKSTVASVLSTNFPKVHYDPTGKQPALWGARQGFKKKKKNKNSKEKKVGDEVDTDNDGEEVEDSVEDETGYEQMEVVMKEQEEKLEKIERENRALKGEINNITLPELLRIEKDLEQALKLVRQRIAVSSPSVAKSPLQAPNFDIDSFLCNTCTKTVSDCNICSQKIKGVKLRPEHTTI